MSDLEQVIADSVDDALEPETPEVEATPEADVTTDVTTEEPAEPLEVSSPAAKEDAPVEAKPAEDEFAKKHGLQPQAPGARENRLPYSRVKKIVENAEKPLQAKVTEYEGKVKDYEERLTNVGKFEDLMVKDQVSFLRMLAEKVPGYAELFSQLQGSGQQSAPEASQKATEAPVGDDMPQPDYKMPDGSMVYSLDGLKARDAWNRAQAKKEVLDAVDKKYGPIFEEREQRAKVEALIPQVQRQIDTARSWPHFKDNEDAITEALAQNPTMSLEGAYAYVLNTKVVPTLQTNKETMEKEIRERTRKEVLAELKKAPSTSIPSGGVKPGAQKVGGSRSLEDVIKDSIDGAGLH